jgi:hypothetical protein
MTPDRDDLRWRDTPANAGEEGRPRGTAGPDDHDARRRLATLLGRLVADMWAARDRDSPTDGAGSRRADDAPP